MATLSCSQVTSSCGKIKILFGRREVKALPAVDLAQRNLSACQQSPEEHASGLSAGQHALGLDPPLELLMQAFDGIGGTDRTPLLGWEAQEGEEPFSRLFQTVGDGSATHA